MPQPIVYDRDAALRQGITQAGSAVGSAIGKSAEERAKLEKQRDFMQSIGLAPPASQDGNISTPTETGVPGFNESITNNNPPSNNTLSNLSDDQLVKLLAFGPPAAKDIVKFEQKKRQTDRQNFNADRTYHTNLSQKPIEEFNKIRASQPKKRLALQLATEAVNSGDVGPLSLANFAKVTGIPALQTVSGKALEIASKENLLGNLGRLSARAQNQWMEKVVQGIFPQIGESLDTAKSSLIPLGAEAELDDLYVNEFAKLYQNDMKTLGYIKGDIENRARENIKQAEDLVFEKTSFQSREIFETQKGDEWLIKNSTKKPLKGTYLTPQNMRVFATQNGGIKKGIEKAKKMGYMIPTQTEVIEWSEYTNE